MTLTFTKWVLNPCPNKEYAPVSDTLRINVGSRYCRACKYFDSISETYSVECIHPNYLKDKAKLILKEIT